MRSQGRWPRTSTRASLTPWMRDTLDRYRQTFASTQVMIVAITLFVLLRTHHAIAAMAFFGAMQIGGVVGAAWGARLKQRLEGARLGVRR